MGMCGRMMRKLSAVVALAGCGAVAAEAGSEPAVTVRLTSTAVSVRGQRIAAIDQDFRQRLGPGMVLPALQDALRAEALGSELTVVTDVDVPCLVLLSMFRTAAKLKIEKVRFVRADAPLDAPHALGLKTNTPTSVATTPIFTAIVTREGLSLVPEALGAPEERPARVHRSSGPTLPRVNGSLDLSALQRWAVKLKARHPEVKSMILAVESGTPMGELLSVYESVGWDSGGRELFPAVEIAFTDSDDLDWDSSERNAAASQLNDPFQRALAAYVKAHVGPLQGCYETHVLAGQAIPDRSLRVMVRFTIKRSGRVDDIVVKTPPANEAFASCIQAAVQSWALPLKPKDDVPVLYPFVFSPATLDRLEEDHQ
ncbi:MAG TPA: AgmX/PglI C-terminal domain-containing protein [Myxococcaceae bacterium]|jgi:TonB family protein